MATRKKPKPTNALVPWQAPNTKTQPRKSDNDQTLRVVSGIAGYSLIAATHPNGFFAGLAQLAKDQAELAEFRAEKAKKK